MSMGLAVANVLANYSWDILFCLFCTNYSFFSSVDVSTTNKIKESAGLFLCYAFIQHSEIWSQNCVSIPRSPADNGYYKDKKDASMKLLIKPLPIHIKLLLSKKWDMIESLLMDRFTESTYTSRTLITITDGVFRGRLSVLPPIRRLLHTPGLLLPSRKTIPTGLFL